MTSSKKKKQLTLIKVISASNNTLWVEVVSNCYNFTF